jgi:Arc/MetJ-type ribon-helix-helix transcriptional regulator
MTRHKTTVSLSLHPQTLEWIDKLIEKNVFRNRSHAVEYCILRLEKELEEGHVVPMLFQGLEKSKD